MLSIVETTITPEDAAKLMAANAENNRNINQTTVSTYTDDMTHNRWPYVADTIRVSETGRLLDGQHRMLAVIASGRPLKAILITGLPDGAISRIDLGRRRTVADLVDVNTKGTGVTQTKAIGAVGRRVLLWTDYGLRRGLGTRVLSPTEVSDYCLRPDVLPELIESVRVVRAARLSAMVSAMYVVTARIDREAARAFFTGLTTGADLSTGSPVLALRNRLIASRVRPLRDSRERTNPRLSDDLTAELVCRAWYAYRTGRQLLRVQLGDPNGTYPEPI